MKTTTEVYEMRFDPELGCIYMKWDGYATSGQFREGTELMLNLLIQNRCSKVLADIRDMVLIGQEDQQWLINVFVPRAMRFGFEALAIITPSSYFNQVALQNVIGRMNGEKINVRFFDTIGEAGRWLKTELL